MPFVHPNANNQAKICDLIGEKLKSIVYTKISDFDTVIAGLKTLIAEEKRLVALAAQIHAEIDALEEPPADPNLEFITRFNEIADAFQETEQRPMFFANLPAALTDLAEICDPACFYVEPNHLQYFQEMLAKLCAAEEEKYALTRNRTGYFIDQVLETIPFKSLEDFPHIFAELDRLAAGADTQIPAVSTPILALMAREYGITAHNADTFRPILAERVNIFKGKFNSETERKEYVAKWLPKRTRPVYPTPTILKQMHEYNIAPTTLQPEFELMVKVIQVCDLIDIYLGDPEDPANDIAVIRENIREVFAILNLPYTPEHYRSLEAEKKLRLEGLLFLLDRSTFTVAELTNNLDAEGRTDLIKHAEELLNAFNIAQAKDQNTAELYTYIQYQKRLRELAYEKQTAVIKKSYAQLNHSAEPTADGDGNTVASDDEEPNFDLDFDEPDTDFLARTRVLSDIMPQFKRILKFRVTPADQEATDLKFASNIIQRICMPHKLSLQTVRQFDPLCLAHVIELPETFKKITGEAEIPATVLLALPENTLYRLILNYNSVQQICAASNIELRQILSLPAAHLEFLLQRNNLERVTILCNYYFLPKEYFLQADLDTKRQLINDPKQAIAIFDQTAKTLTPAEFAAALQTVATLIAPELAKIQETASIYNLSRFCETMPRNIVLALKHQGLTFIQCRAIYEHCVQIFTQFYPAYVSHFMYPTPKTVENNAHTMDFCLTQAELAAVNTVLSNIVETMNLAVQAPANYSQKVAQFFPEVHAIVQQIIALDIADPSHDAQEIALIRDLNRLLHPICMNPSEDCKATRFFFLLHYLTHNNIAQCFVNADGRPWKNIAKLWVDNLDDARFEDPIGLLEPELLVLESGAPDTDAEQFDDFVFYCSTLYHRFIKPANSFAIQDYLGKDTNAGADICFKFLEKTSKTAHSFRKLLQQGAFMQNPMSVSLYSASLAHNQPEAIAQVSAELRQQSHKQLHAFLCANGFRSADPLLSSFSAQQAFTQQELNSNNAAGFTPLTLAIQFHATDIALALLAHGADPALADAQARVPIAMAGERGMLSTGFDLSGTIQRTSALTAAQPAA